MDKTIEVEAAGPIRHGNKEGVTDYVAGDRFTVTLKEAASLVASGAVIQPGTKPADAKAAKEVEKTEAEIDAANAKAEAEAKAKPAAKP
jgi:hypothetical protein